MKSWLRVGCIGCFTLIILSLLALGSCAVLCSRSTQREPELPIREFLQKQVEVFPSTWYLEESDIELWTSAADPYGKFTNASWAVAADFWYKDGVRISKGLATAHEQIHVYKSPFCARTVSYPSEYWATYWEGWITPGEGYIPRGWKYRPSHADRFDLRCWGGDGIAQPDLCSFIVRYEEYIIVFDTPIARYMTLEDLERVLEVIDREMADFLQHSTLRPGPRKVPKSLDP